MPPDEQFAAHLRKQLQQLRKRILQIRFAEGVGVTIISASVFLLLAVALDWFVDVPVWFRTILLAGLPVLICTLIIKTVWRSFFQKIESTQLAAVVESVHLEFQERLITAVQLAEQPVTQSPTSATMQRLLHEQTSNLLGDGLSRGSVKTRRVKTIAATCVVLIAFILSPLAIAPNAYAAMFSRFLQPWGDHDRPTNLMLSIVDAPTIIGRGDDLKIVVAPQWRYLNSTPPETVLIKWTEQNSQRHSRKVLFNSDSQTYELTIPRVTSSLTVLAQSDTTRSQTASIEVKNRPRLSEISAVLTPPAYTQLPTENFSPLLGELQVFEHSQVELRFRFSEPVTSAEILWLDRTGTQLAADGTTVQQTQVRGITPLDLQSSHDATASFVSQIDNFSGRFAVRATNEFDLTSQNEEIRWLHLNRDQSPTAIFSDREQASEARPHDIFKVPTHSSDDFSVTSLELHLEWTRSSEQHQRVFAVPDETLRNPSVSHQFELDLSEFELPAGTAIALKLRSTDNREVPGPNETWSEPRTLRLRIDAKAQGDQALEEQQRKTIQELTQMQTAANEQKQAARLLQQEIQADKSNDLLEERQNQAAQIEAQIEQLNEQLEKFTASMEGQPLFEHLAQKAQEISEQSVSQAAASAEAAQNADNASDQQKNLNDAANKLQKAAKEIDELQKDFQEVSQLQRDLLELNRIADQTEKLAVDVDGLSGRQNLAARNAVAKQAWQKDHGQLVVRHRQLEDDLDILLEKHPDLMEKAKESMRVRLLEISELTESLSRQQSSLASANRNDLNRRRKEFTDLTEREEQLQRETSNVLATLSEQPDHQDAILAQNLQKEANQALDAGDLASAEMAHRSIAERLQILEQRLETTPLEAFPEAAERLRISASQNLEMAAEISHRRVEILDKSVAAHSAEIFQIYERQDDLLQRSRRLTNSIRQLGLKNSQDIRKLTETADLARQTLSSLQQLNFRHSSEASIKSAAKDLELLELLQQTSSPKIPDRILELAEELHRDQSLASQALQELAASPEQQKLYRVALQEDYQRTVAGLTEELTGIARDLNLTRIKLPKNAKAAQDAQAAAAQSESRLRSSLQDQMAINQASSAKKLDESSEALRQVSQHAKTAAEGTNTRAVTLSNIPGEVGRTVAHSSELLMQAGFHLSDMRVALPTQSEQEKFFDDLKNMALPPGTDESHQNPDAEKQNSERSGSGGQSDQETGNDSAQSESENGRMQQDNDGQIAEQSESANGEQQNGERSGESQSMTSSTLREAASGLRMAAQQMGISSQKQEEDKQTQQQPGKESEQSNSDEAGSEAVDGELHLQDLDSGIQGAGKNWGRLPGKIQTEMLESARRGRDPIYRGVIQRYFEEIARPRSASDPASTR